MQAELAQILSEFDELADDGREKRALDRSCGMAGENRFLDLAERVGVLEVVFHPFADSFRGSLIHSNSGS